MFSKLTMSLVMAISLMLSSSVFAQATKKTDPKKAEEAKASEASQKAEAEKVLEAKRVEEAKLAAEKAKAEDEAGFYGYLKSHFSASYHGEYYFTRRVDYDQEKVDSAAGQVFTKDDKKLQDLKIMHNPTVIYRPFTNFKILVTSEFKYTDALVKGSFINRHYRSLILVTRENVLTEKDNGIKMDVGLGRRIFDRNHGAASGYGNSRVNTTLSKKFGDKLSTGFFAQYLANDPVNAKIGANTWKHSLELIPSFTFQITDKLSYFFNDDFIFNTPWITNDDRNYDVSHEMNIGVVSYQFNDKNSSYFQFKYLHFSDLPFGKENLPGDWFEYYIGHTYSVTPKFNVTAEVGSEIFRGKDKRDFFAEKVKYPEFALYLDYSL